MIRLTVVFVLALVATRVQADLWGTLTPGAHAPGFEVIHTEDMLRTSEAGASRPLQISVWYPAVPDSSTFRMHLGDYVTFSARETAANSDGITDEEIDRARSRLGDFPVAGVDDEAKEMLSRLPVRATTGAEKASGRFPLLVLIQGNHDPAFGHFVLAEYLSSHGYVVATVPSASRYVRDQIDMNFGNGPYVDQIRDTALVIDYMRGQYDHVDPGKVMLLGFSVGGNTGGYNLLRNTDVSGFVCLDCGLGSTWGTAALNRTRDTLFPDAVGRHLAILHLSKGDDRDDDSFIDSFYNATAYHGTVNSARHFNFTSLGAMAAEVPPLENTDWLLGGSVAREIHDQVLEMTRQFLDAHLGHRADAARELGRYRDTSAGHIRLHRITRPGNR